VSHNFEKRKKLHNNRVSHLKSVESIVDCRLGGKSRFENQTVQRFAAGRKHSKIDGSNISVANFMKIRDEATRSTLGVRSGFKNNYPLTRDMSMGVEK